MLSGDQNKPNPNSALGDSAVPETPTTGGTTENNLPSGSGPGATGRTSLYNPTTTTFTITMPGELHPQAGTHPASMSTGTLPIPVANTGGTTKKRRNGLFGVRSSEEVLRTTPAASQQPPRLWRMDCEGAVSTGGVAPAQNGSDMYDSEGDSSLRTFRRWNWNCDWDGHWRFEASSSFRYYYQRCVLIKIL